MRTTLGSLITRAVVGLGVLVGVVLGVREAAPGHVDPITTVACAAHLPGMAARCASDRLVAHVGPAIWPAVVGGLAGLVTALVLIGLLRVPLRRPTA